WVDFPAFQAAAYFRQGDLDKMWASWRVFLAEFAQKINGGQPADTQTALRWMKDVNPYRSTTQLTPFWEYMSQADLEEIEAEQPEETAATAASPNRFTQAAGVWTVTYDGKQAQLPDRKGYHDLARLL